MVRKGRGKKITTWQYRGKDGVRFDIPVHLVTNVSQYGTESTAFEVRLPDIEVAEEGVDLNELKTRVMAVIAEKLSIAWERHLMVSVRADNDPEVTAEFQGMPSVNTKLDAGLALRVHSVEVGRSPAGKMLSRDYQYHNPVGREGMPTTGYDNRGQMLALIPDTPANREALATIADAIERLGEQLTELLHPDRVARSLEIVLAAKGLPALDPPLPPAGASSGHATAASMQASANAPDSPHLYAKVCGGRDKGGPLDPPPSAK